MRRSLLIIIIVALLSALISRAERVSGAQASQNDWIRTTTGWERRAGLTAERSQPQLGVHPALLATFQLGASLFVLLAFPGRAVRVAAPQPAASHLHLAAENRRDVTRAG